MFIDFSCKIFVDSNAMYVTHPWKNMILTLSVWARADRIPSHSPEIDKPKNFFLKNTSINSNERYKDGERQKKVVVHN